MDLIGLSDSTTSSYEITTVSSCNHLAEYFHSKLHIYYRGRTVQILLYEPNMPIDKLGSKRKSQISKNNVKLHDYKGLFFKIHFLKICLTIIILLSNNQTLTSPVNGLEIEHRALSRLPFTKNFGTFAFYKKKHKHIQNSRTNQPC